MASFPRRIAKYLAGKLRAPVTPATRRNCIGFSITIVSIALLGWLIETAGPRYAFLILVPAPVLGPAALSRLAARPV